MAKADPLKSEGARMERRAFRAYLRRLLNKEDNLTDLHKVLDWVLSRQKRYDVVPGGLGK